jgi:hypothetical protein
MRIIIEDNDKRWEISNPNVTEESDIYEVLEFVKTALMNLSFSEELIIEGFSSYSTE